MEDADTYSSPGKNILWMLITNPSYTDIQLFGTECTKIE